ncbi:hypothetical protein VP01_4521g1 [Puccinia sorghi]|uniref:Uncharacterized protein n=1 Tax=Puccinia sorghi TaxID=27349 RepID=A0A0L6UPT4_9BASI|nr:hypothetical protein VP01_4521g1 [Puccinia sorghi]
MQKVPGSFSCYSNHAPKVIQPSFDAQSLCRLKILHRQTCGCVATLAIKNNDFLGISGNTRGCWPRVGVQQATEDNLFLHVKYIIHLSCGKVSKGLMSHKSGNCCKIFYCVRGWMVLYHSNFNVKICQVFLSLVSQAPFCYGISQLMVGPDDVYSCLLSLTLANQLTLKAKILKSSEVISFFPSSLLELFCFTGYLIFVFYNLVSAGTMTQIISPLSLSYAVLSFPLNIIHCFSLLVFPGLPSLSSSHSKVNQMDKFSNQCPNCIVLYNKKKVNVSSRWNYHKAHSMQPQAPLWVTVVDRSAECLHSFSQANSPCTPQTKFPITSPSHAKSNLTSYHSSTTFLIHKPGCSALIAPLCPMKMTQKGIMDEAIPALINHH